MARPIKSMDHIKVGGVFPTTHGDVVVTRINAYRRVTVCFLEYPYEITIRADQLTRGSARNPLRPSVYGVGFTGIGHHFPRMNGVITKAYTAWCHMLERVYQPNSERVAREYAGTSVHPEWHNFQNFANWFEQHFEIFRSVAFRCELDKDLLFPGNKIYGPYTCCLVPQAINTLLIDAKFSRGDLPLGVSHRKNRFQASVNINGRMRNIGCYATIKEAQLAYWKEKFQAIQYSAIIYWNYLPEQLAMRLLHFGWPDAFAYYGDDARLWADNEGYAKCRTILPLN